MSYESEMLKQLGMPPREEVARALLISLLRHGGVIKEFAAGQDVVVGLAGEFGLSQAQLEAALKTVYRKENRPKIALLWHRLLFRAADLLAKRNFVSRPTETVRLTGRKEWMLTESGLDEVLKLSSISKNEKESLAVKSFEVQRIAKRLADSPRPEQYDPIDKKKRVATRTTETAIRARGFRQAVIEAYGYRCSVCGLKMMSPNALAWEVEAAHIVPNRMRGRDDAWNGLALCHIHHWAFDVGWFTLRTDYTIEVERRVASMPSEHARIEGHEIIRNLSGRIILPGRASVRPHESAIIWHRQNIFGRI